MQNKLLNISKLLNYIYNKLSHVTKLHLQSLNYIYKNTESQKYNQNTYQNQYL